MLSESSPTLIGRIQTPIAPMRELLVRQLRALIGSGELSSGRRITERELIEQSGASRSVVRESMIQLEAEGLLQREGSRIVVASLSREEAFEIYAIRASLEPLAAALCAKRAPEKLLTDLRSTETRFLAAIEEEGLDLALRVKEELYTLIYQGAQLPIVAATMQPLQTRVQQMRSTSFRRPNRALDSAAEIKRLIDAIVGRDPVEAAAAARAHVRAAAGVLDDPSESNHYLDDLSLALKCASDSHVIDPS